MTAWGQIPVYMLICHFFFLSWSVMTSSLRDIFIAGEAHVEAHVPVFSFEENRKGFKRKEQLIFEFWRIRKSWIYYYNILSTVSSCDMFIRSTSSLIIQIQTDHTTHILNITYIINTDVCYLLSVCLAVWQYVTNRDGRHVVCLPVFPQSPSSSSVMKPEGAIISYWSPVHGYSLRIWQSFRFFYFLDSIELGSGWFKWIQNVTALSLIWTWGKIPNDLCSFLWTCFFKIGFLFHTKLSWFQ